MRFRALAMDGDGTLTEKGRMTDATLEALMRARRSGCKLLLVTGETLDELKEFPHLELFDGVVAEDGGVLVWPANGKHKALGPAPPQDFVGYLKDKKVKPLRIGEVMVGTDEPHEKTLRDGIARCRLAYVVHANREQLMALPEGIDKESGLRALLKHLDIRCEEAAAIGDAENDQPLLAACGFGAAVANAVACVKEQAAFVTHASAGAGVCELIDRLLAEKP